MKQNIVFKEWLPDQPEMNNPGLIEAKNVLPLNSAFASFRPLSPIAGTVGALIVGAFGSADPFNVGSYSYYGTPTGLFLYNGVSSDDVSGATYGGATESSWAFAQYENLVFASNWHDAIQYHTAGSSSNFATLASINARYVGVVNQFIVVGDVSGVDPAYVRWSAIDSPTNWPTPGSATAIATQAGEQYFDQNKGPITGFASGDQFGLVFQRNSITRMTYVGPPVVFQFDNYTNNFGAAYPFSIVQYKGMTYFAGDSGICATDGVTVFEIGKGKVNDYFLSRVFVRNRVRSACDEKNGLIYFSFSTNALNQIADSIIIYNVAENRFSFAEEDVYALHSVPRTAEANTQYLRGWNSANQLSTFSATAGSAVLQTGDLEFVPGGRSYVDAVKPSVQYSSTAPSIGVRVGYRDDLGSDPTYTATAGPLARTGFANARVDSKYIRFEVNISGNFENISGLEHNARPSGSA